MGFQEALGLTGMYMDIILKFFIVHWFLGILMIIGFVYLLMKYGWIIRGCEQ